MGNKYTVYASRYPYNGWWEIDKKGFETLEETIEYVKQCQSNGYVTRISCSGYAWFNTKFCKTERETILKKKVGSNER